MVRNRKRWGVGLLALLAAMLVFALAPTQALAKTGWVKQSNGKYRYYYEDGRYYSTGLYEINGQFYGFDKSGYRLSKWYEDASGADSEWVYLGEKNNAASVGWKLIGGKWYYFESVASEEGDHCPPFMLKNNCYLIDQKNYVFNASGALVGSGWHKITHEYSDGESITWWYYTNSGGVAAVGWKKISGTWYYFYDFGGMAHNTVMPYNGKFYGITESGALTGAGWFKVRRQDPNYEYHTTWYYAGSDGVLKKGWQKVDGSWYYFEKGKSSSGALFEPMMYADGLYQIDGKYYYFNKGGDMATGWKMISSNWYYFDGSGAMVRSRWVGNYYLGSDGAMLRNTVTPDGYRVDGNGKWDGKPKVAA